MNERNYYLKELSIKEIERLNKYELIFYTKESGKDSIFQGVIKKLSKGIFTGNPLIHILFIVSSEKIGCDKLDLVSPKNKIFQLMEK